MEKKQAKEIFDQLKELFPDACCELVYNNVFELLVATVLSAQTTDKAVNNVTKELFSKYPNPFVLKNASPEDVEKIIFPIGLSKSKSRNIILLSNTLVNDFNGEVPSDFDKLITLPGVGRKTANVILAEGFNINRIAVDTHVARVSFRLGLSNSTDVLKIEEDLQCLYPEDIWKELHLQLLFFGRYLCKSKNPDCKRCPFINICKKDN